MCLSDAVSLDHADAIKRIPRCRTWALKNLPIEYEHLIHFRTKGIGFGACAIRDSDGSIDIIFNDAHPPKVVRTFMMEEVFHLRLGHPPDSVRLYPEAGAFRKYSQAKELEAYGCGLAALVPYGGLEAMLADGVHLSRIAEHFVVPDSVVEFRVEATKLGNIANATISQRSLISDEKYY